MKPKKLILWLKEAIFPSLCVVCAKKTFKLDKEFQWLCPNCTMELKSSWQTICLICTKDLSFSEKNTCAHSPGFIKNVSFIFNYQNRSAKALIHALKYKFITDITDIFSKYLIRERLNLLRIPADLIIPLPLHKRKLRRRGFNQSELIARDIAKLINKPVLDDVLVKYRNTPAQMKIKKPSNRSVNIRGAFKVRNKLATRLDLPASDRLSRDGSMARQVKNKNILLVDDVITTGSTLEEAAKTLLESGARNVYAFVLAKD